MRSAEEDEDLSHRPLGPVVLPQSITQEAEDADLKRRFGVEALPDFSQRHGSVHLAQSGGAFGPLRERKRSAAALLFLILVVVAGYYYVHTNGGLEAVLEGTPLEGTF